MAETTTTTDGTPTTDATTNVDQSATDTHTNPPTDDNGLGDAGKAALDAERKARRQADKDLKAALAKIQAFEDANKSETEKLTERLTQAEQQAAEAQARYQEVVTKQAIYDAANTAGSTDPETVYLYLRQDVEVGDDGTVNGIDAALKALQSSKPHLFRQTHEGFRDAANRGTPPALNSDDLTNAIARAVGAK